jgi:hypothetical protein
MMWTGWQRAGPRRVVGPTPALSGTVLLAIGDTTGVYWTSNSGTVENARGGGTPTTLESAQGNPWAIAVINAGRVAPSARA